MDTEPPLTAGALRALLADLDLPDDTPVRIDATEPGDGDPQVLVTAIVDRYTVEWGELEYSGRPYLLLESRPESMADHRSLTSPATTEDDPPA